MPTWKMLLVTKAGTRDQTRRGEKLLEFVHYFNSFPVNLFQNCNGPLDIFLTCARFHSNIDYILLPNCWFEKISYAKKDFLFLIFCFSVDNTSDHGPIQVEIDLPFSSVLPLGGNSICFSSHS